jgi:transcriptional regulator GlxA family with amidase domain
MDTRNVVILLFNDVEVLDFAGPFEVFNVANEAAEHKAFFVYTVAEGDKHVRARNGLKVTADFTLSEAPRPDIIVVPGGNGRRIQMDNEVVLDWLRESFALSEHVLSVCTGAFILGKAGLLKGLKATTHHASYAEFESTFDDVKLVKHVKFVDNGKVVTAGGISAGIDMSLHMVDKLLGNGMGKKTAEEMEYDLHKK